MFGFLKKKIGEAIGKFTEKAKEEPAKEAKQPEEEKLEQPKAEAETGKSKEPSIEKKPKTETIKAKTEKAEAAEPKAAPVAEEKAAPTKEQAEPKGIFGKLKGAISGAVTTTRISESRFEEMFWDLELALLENNTAVEVIDKVKKDLKDALVEKPLQRGKIEEAIKKSLRESIGQLFQTESDFMEKVKTAVAQNKPVRIMFVGINGSGKTTTIAKIAKKLQDNKLKVVIAAADTFRAAAIHQLQEHADKLGVKLIKHDYGSDPAAVAFDTIKFAEAHGIDVVLIDTAGRLHSNVNLMDEMKKVARVSKPDFKIFIGESITGNDCVEQAKSFNEAIGIDGIILSKADIDEKGGAAISVSYVTKKPIYYIGTGQGYEDLKQFDPKLIFESVGL